MNLLVLGDFVAIDNPQPLETQIEEILGVDQQQYSLLYSIWAFPSIIVPFFGGYLTDKLGVRPALITFSLAITIGQFIYVYGGYSLQFSWMLAGRAIYAIGSDPLNVAQIVITNKWFQGNEVGLAMALGTTTCGIGRAVNSFLVPKLYDMSQDLTLPMLFSGLVCVMALVSTVLMVILDKVNDTREKKADERQKLLAEEEKISLKDLRYFKSIAWMVIFNFALTNAVFLSYNAFSNDLYHVQYNFTNSAAGSIISISFIITAVSSTLFGKIVDSYGYRATIILYNSLLGVFAFIYYLIVPQCDQCMSTIVPQVFFGLLIGINDAAVFPALPLVLEEKYLGTGFGLFFVIQNIMVLVLPLAAAAIQENTSQDPTIGYYWMFVFFGVWSLFTVVESVVLFIKDKKTGRVLDKTIAEEEEDDDQSGFVLSGSGSQVFDSGLNKSILSSRAEE